MIKTTFTWYYFIIVVIIKKKIINMFIKLAKMIIKLINSINMPCRIVNILLFINENIIIQIKNVKCSIFIT